MAKCSRCHSYAGSIVSTFGYCDECEAELARLDHLHAGDRIVVRCPQPALDGRAGTVRGVNAKTVRVALDGDKYGLCPFPHHMVEKIA